MSDKPKPRTIEWRLETLEAKVAELEKTEPTDPPHRETAQQAQSKRLPLWDDVYIRVQKLEEKVEEILKHLGIEQ